MLTELQYKELLPYCGEGIQFNSHPDDTMKYFIRKKYIIGYKPISPDGNVCGDTVTWVITDTGKRALEEFEEQMCKERAEQDKNKNVMKSQRSANRFDAITFGTISAVIGSVIGGLIVYYWPAIVDFFFELFQ